MSKILHISNMEALCQAIEILRPRHCCCFFFFFFFLGGGGGTVRKRKKRKSDTKNLGLLTKFNCQKVL